MENGRKTKDDDYLAKIEQMIEVKKRENKSLKTLYDLINSKTKAQLDSQIKKD